jgi:hypothetical protein
VTTIERFQTLQVELVRAGFATELFARPDRDQAKVSMFIELEKQTAGDMEQLDALAGTFGFTYTVGENSRAALSLAGEPARR